MSLTEQEKRALFCKMTGRVATIDSQSYFAFCKGIEVAVMAKQKAEPVLHAIENCRLYAARHRKEGWAEVILRFCAEAGVSGSPMRDATTPVVPDDMVMVPRSPTRAMLDAAHADLVRGGEIDPMLKQCYHAMIAVAQEEEA